MTSVYERRLIPESPDAEIATRAATQHGVFSRRQAFGVGFTEAMIYGRLASGRWHRLHPGVYRLAGSPSTSRQSLMATCLAWGPGSTISHRSAGVLWRIVSLTLDFVELIVPRNRRRAEPGIVHRPRSLPSVDITLLEGIPVTTPARTLLDLAAVVPRDVLEEAIDDALRRKLVSLPRLGWRLQEIGGMGTAGSASLRALIVARGPGTQVPQSVLETKLLRTMKVAGLPDPVTQHEIRVRGRLVAVVDFAFPDARVAVEAEGYRWHSGRQRFDSDLARRNALTSLGWRIVHFTWRDLDDPETVRETVIAAMISR